MKISTLPFIQNSVRCLFPMAALSAVFGPAYLVTVIINQYPFEHPFFTIFEWHAFEMLYGFLLTLVAGFILTAGGHWTGRGPLRGRWLFILFGLWFVDKIILFAPLPNPVYFIAAALFPATFLVSLSRLLRGYRQYGRFIGLTGFLSASKLLYLGGAIYESPELKNFSMKAVIWVIIMLVAIIGGRVTPRFTKNFFGLKQELAPPKHLETALFVTLASTMLWLIPHGLDWLNALIFVTAGVLNLVRASFYLPCQAMKKPMLGMLHLGYSIYALGLIYMGLAQVFQRFDIGKGSLHFLATGGFSIIAINIMTRASLGHTGRPIKLTPLFALMFACIVIGAFLRAFIPPIWPNLYFPSLHYSMGFWTLGFVLYLVKFLPIMFKDRADLSKQL